MGGTQLAATSGSHELDYPHGRRASPYSGYTADIETLKINSNKTRHEQSSRNVFIANCRKPPEVFGWQFSKARDSQVLEVALSSTCEL